MSNHQQRSVKLSVLLLQEGRAWVAQCLEHDLCVQGESDAEAKERFAEVLGLQLADDILSGREPLSGIPRAPKTYWKMYLTGKADAVGRPIYVPAEEGNLPTLDVISNFVSVAAAC